MDKKINRPVGRTVQQARKIITRANKKERRGGCLADIRVRKRMDGNELRIERVFNAPKEAVWKAWTDPELIKLWWGPEGFTAPSIKVDLREGGKYTFAMKGPEGSEWDKVMYSSGIYKEIIPNEKIVVTDYFSDENGEKMEPKDFGQDQNFPTEMQATILFEDTGNGTTKLTIIYPKPENEAQFEAMLKSGMKEGWQSSLNKLEKVLQKS